MIGETLGSYLVERPLGSGGMGEVFLGVHRRIGRRVAIKLLLPEYCGSQVVLGRFFTEARATSLIEHPGIVQILDCDVHASGRAYIIMEYLHGESLRTALYRFGPLAQDLPAAVSILAQAAEAVSAAHQKGIVHRDLKPDNIFLVAHVDRGHLLVKVLDFGIAKLLVSDGSPLSQTRTGNLLGTPLYMSPEQCRSAGGVDHRSDIYSLGCIGFEMMCSRPPFTGAGITDLLIAHASLPPPTPTSLGANLPTELEELILTMLAKDPDQRPASMAHVAAALRAMAKDLPAPTQHFFVQPPPLPEANARTAVLPVAGATPMGMSAPARTPSPHRTPSGVHKPAAPVPRPTPASNTTLAHTTGSMDAVDDQLSLRNRSRPALMGGAAFVALLAVGALAWSGVFSSSSSHRRKRGSAEPAGVDEPVPAVQPPQREPATPIEPAVVTIDVEDPPESLSLTVDGAKASLPLRLPRDGAVRRLVFVAPGFAPETQMIEASANQTLKLSLKKQERSPNAGKERSRDKIDSRAHRRKSKLPDAIIDL